MKSINVFSSFLLTDIAISWPWIQLRCSTLSLVLCLAKHTFLFWQTEPSPFSPFLSCVHPFQGCEVTGAGHSSHWEALCLHLPAATHHIRRPSTATHDGLWWVLCIVQNFCQPQLDFFFIFLHKFVAVFVTQSILISLLSLNRCLG